ncbi:diguanylate cyclase domain-containing protein [Aromatoleum sp.]|uniref:diguanylate cyclase domain-containing protein n=1 Tax=Aromatoleum sp. TaxID=2307007 RepID=UPI002FC67146
MELDATLSHGAPGLDFKALFEATPTPYLVLSPDFTIVAVNNAYLQATQTVRGDILGRGIFEVFPDNPGDPLASGVANLKASLERVLRVRCADTMAIKKYDVAVPGPQGSVFEERFWSPINTPVLDAAAGLTYIIHRVEDVTDFVRTRARAERMESEMFDQTIEVQNANRRLREANEELDRRVVERTEEVSREREYFRSLLMALPVPVSVMLGPDHRYQLENDAHRILISGRPILGKPFREAFPESAEMLPVLDHTGETGKPLRLRGATIDISQQVQIQEELRIAKDKLSLAIDGAGEGLCEWDMRTGGTHYSLRLKQILGYTDEELPDCEMRWLSRIHPEDRERVHTALRDYLEGRTQTYISEYRVRCRTGDYKWVLTRGTVTARDEAGRPLRMSGMISDISERKEADERIWHLANFDVLTGLPNRRLFRDRLEHNIKLSARHNHSLALLFIDLDRFKQINDSLGHDVGDLLLVQAAQRIRGAVRAADTVARLGGDEFTVMVDEVDNREEMVEQIADKILRALAAPFDLHKESVNISGSIGMPFIRWMPRRRRT